MPNPVWPLTLPQKPLFEGYREAARARVVESPMDVGPAKVRLRTAIDLRDVRAAYKMTDAQRATFIGFYNATIFAGALKFDWPHPILLVAKEARLMAKDGQDFGEKIAPDAWIVTLELEVRI